MDCSSWNQFTLHGHMGMLLLLRFKISFLLHLGLHFWFYYYYYYCFIFHFNSQKYSIFQTFSSIEISILKMRCQIDYDLRDLTKVSMHVNKTSNSQPPQPSSLIQLILLAKIAITGSVTNLILYLTELQGY